MTARLAAAAGVLVLVLVWSGPVPALVAHSFAAHMVLHVAVVTVAAPLLALGLGGSRLDPTDRLPLLFAPLNASLVELIVVWGWHVPALHELARSSWALLGVEQASFLAAGLLVWLAALGGAAAHRMARRAAGVAALLFTSMHMTLLGALLSLAPRVLYPGKEHAHGVFGLSPLEDQQLGGTVMLLVGGASYLIGGLCLLSGLLRERGAASLEGGSGADRA